MNNQSRLHTLLTSSLLLLFSACSNQSDELPTELNGIGNLTVYDDKVDPVYSINLVRQNDFGDTEDVSFVRMTDIEVDPEGNVFIVEGASEYSAIYLFDSKGDLLQEIGRAGDGPGEFRGIFDIVLYQGLLFVLDGNLMRIQIFDTDSFDLLHDVSLDPSQWDDSDEQGMTFPERLFVLDDSRLLIRFNHTTMDVDRNYYYHLDYDGQVSSDRLISHDFIQYLSDPNSSRKFFDPFGGRGVVAVSGSNQIYTAWSEELLFNVYDANGSYERAFYHPFNNAGMSRSEALNYFDNDSFRRAIENAGVPTQWRAFDHFIIDAEDRLWISTISGNPELYEWWAMDKKGNILATMEWPRHKEIREVKDGILYAIETEEETGLQRVVTWQITWERSGN